MTQQLTKTSRRKSKPTNLNSGKCIVLKKTSIALFTLASAFLAWAAPSLAVAMTVQPVIVDLSPAGRKNTALISVDNPSREPLPVELRIYEAVLDANGVTVSSKASEDLLIFPPQAIIAPSATQSFRVQYIGDPGMERSRHYYVTVAQLPVQLPEGTSAIQIVYNFNVVVSVAAPGQTAQISAVSGEVAKNSEDKPVAAFTIANTGRNYDYLINGRLRLVQKDIAGREIYRRTLSGQEIQQTIGFGLIGPELQRRIVTSIELPSAEGSLNVEFTPDRRR
jgi:fimbrial chaperone protein